MKCFIPTGAAAPDSAGMRLMSAVGHLKDVCSSTVSKECKHSSTAVSYYPLPPPTHTHMYTHSHVHTHTHSHVHTRTLTCTQHTLTHTHTCTHTHMCTHTCTHQVADALATAGEHRKALDQAEKIEQEFVTLMTGQGKEKPALHEERQMVAIKSWSIVIKMQSITTIVAFGIL